MLVGVLDLGLPREMPVTDRRENFDFRVQRSGADFDSDLILPLACTAVSDCDSSLFVGNINKSLGD